MNINKNVFSSLLTWSFLITLALGNTTKCPGLLSRCTCGVTEYIYKQQYIVNCTDTAYNTTKPLEKLPNETQILIFTGNDLPELPANIFGPTEVNNTFNLRVIDMSNNKIKVIHGKAFHKVSTVERLILNHNLLTVDEHHLRMFSNFEKLLELHLTDSFADNSANLSAHLHSLFLNSDLVKLRKLHLEQNEIGSFKDDPVVFCTLESLMDLHLGDNKLQHIHFKMDCLKHLRMLDLERNAIVFLTKDELAQLDAFTKRNNGTYNLTIDLSDNPFSCGYQKEEFFSWLTTTKVKVRNVEKLKCKDDGKTYAHKCPTALKAKGEGGESGRPTGTELFLTTLLLISVGLLIYTNLDYLRRKLTPVLLSLSKKVHYTTIGKTEAQEMEV